MRQKRLTERRNARSSKSDNSLLVIHLERGMGTRAVGRLADISRGPIANGYRSYVCIYIHRPTRPHTHTRGNIYNHSRTSLVSVITSQYEKYHNAMDTCRDNNFYWRYCAVSCSFFYATKREMLSRNATSLSKCV